MLDRDVKNALSRQVPNLAKNKIRGEIRKKFLEIKNQMISEFISNPITQEIMTGPTGPNISGTLNGVSNLFAFIGFDRGAQPIMPILELLEKTELIYKKNLSKPKIGVEFEVTMPTKEQIFAITPLPYETGRSWAEGIERGLSGLGHLIRKNAGRSGSAIQTRVKVRKGKFQNVPYISALLNKYAKKFKDLK